MNISDKVPSHFSSWIHRWHQVVAWSNQKKNVSLVIGESIPFSKCLLNKKRILQHTGILYDIQSTISNKM